MKHMELTLFQWLSVVPTKCYFWNVQVFSTQRCDVTLGELLRDAAVTRTCSFLSLAALCSTNGSLKKTPHSVKQKTLSLQSKLLIFYQYKIILPLE